MGRLSAGSSFLLPVRGWGLFHWKLSDFWVIITIFCLFRAAPRAYGGSQARGRIGAEAASLYQDHSNAGSEPRLQPTPQLSATPDC